MVGSGGKRILKMAASATRNEEHWRKLQLTYEIPVYLRHRTKFQEVSFQYQLIQLITVAISSLKYISGQLPTW